VWWGECGSVKASKLSDLARAFPHARFSVAKWGRSDLRGYASQLRGQLTLPPTRTAPFDLVSFPADSIERCERTRPASAPPRGTHSHSLAPPRLTRLVRGIAPVAVVSDEGELRIGFDDLDVVPLADPGAG
jgi:hypothetical protein